MNRITPIPISTFDGAMLPNAGNQYTEQLKLHLGSHVTMEVFEIGQLDQSSNIILPHWWMVQERHHGLSNPKGNIGFRSAHCVLTCMGHMLSSFRIEYRDHIPTLVLAEDNHSYPSSSVGCIQYPIITLDRQVEVHWNILHISDQRIVGAAAINSQLVA